MNYYEIKITGKDTKRFIRNLYKMHINFYNILYQEKSVIIKVNNKDYHKIKNIKTIYKIEVINKYGYLKLYEYINKYKILLISLIIGFILFLVLTNIIFDVEINHNNKELKNLIYEELEKYNIKKYKFIVSFKKKEEIKDKILNKLNDKLEWIEINRIGTKYVVEVEERKKNTKIDDNTPRNIIAKKNGIITKINSTSGEIVSKVNQYVKKGDILISGVIHKKEDVVDNIKAEGKVFAETWYKVTTELPYHYYEEKIIGNDKYYLKINFLNNEYNIFKNKDISTKDKSLFKIKNFILPISISLEKSNEISIKDEIYTLDNAINIASDLSIKRLKNVLGENIKIIYENNLKLDEINSKIIVEMFYKVIEDITDYEEIR